MPPKKKLDKKSSPSLIGFKKPDGTLDPIIAYNFEFSHYIRFEFLTFYNF